MFLFLLIVDDKDGDEHAETVAEGEEGRRGDSGGEGAVDRSGEDGGERSASEGKEGGKEVDNTVWIHFDDFLELFRFVIPSCRNSYLCSEFETLQDVYFTGVN